MEENQKTNKPWISGKIFSYVIVTVLIIGIGSASSFAYNYSHQREVSVTPKGLKFDDSITEEEKKSDHLNLRIDSSKKRHEECKKIVSQKCRSIDEAEQTLGFKIAQPKLDGYCAKDIYMDQTDTGAMKTISVRYQKEKSTIEMDVMNMKDSSSWSMSDNFTEDETVTHSYVNKAGYDIRIVEFVKGDQKGNMHAIIAFQDYHIRLDCERITYDELTKALDTIDFKIYEC